VIASTAGNVLKVFSFNRTNIPKAYFGLKEGKNIKNPPDFFVTVGAFRNIGVKM
jgi:hypothetical protein